MADEAAKGGTKITEASGFKFETASFTLSKTGTPKCSLPPLPGVTPPINLVPYLSACSE